MKTKKSGVRGSVITSADLEKAADYVGMAFYKLERYPGSLDEALPLGNGSPFDGALIPFDIVANGGRLKADKKTINRFSEAWLLGIPSRCDGEGLLVEAAMRVLNMFSQSGGSDFNRGVFIADYGYFRGELTKWMIRFCRGFVARDFEEIESSIEAINKMARKATSKASIATSALNGVWTDDSLKKAQVEEAARLYKSKVERGCHDCHTLRLQLEAVLGMKELHGIKIPDGIGYNDAIPGHAFYNRVKGELEKRGDWVYRE